MVRVVAAAMLVVAAVARAEPFSHAAWARVLERFVDGEGRVDYAALARDRTDLDAYVGQLAATSPDRQPEAFPTAHDALAYWIDAYNASVMARVVQSYPIASVADASLLGKVGFFRLTRPDLGGQPTSLTTLEHAIIRERFREPRVHFALNCASRGCPHLPREPFSGDRLDAQLDRETRRFLAEERNVHVDHDARTLSLSAIFDWYADDFTGGDEDGGTVLAWIWRHADDARAADLARAAGYHVRFVPYDWRLNDQHPKE